MPCTMGGKRELSTRAAPREKSAGGARCRHALRPEGAARCHEGGCAGGGAPWHGTTGTAPWAWHNEHGTTGTAPRARHRGHGTMRMAPRAWHCGHGTTSTAPQAWHNGHSTVGTAPWARHNGHSTTGTAPRARPGAGSQQPAKQPLRNGGSEAAWSGAAYFYQKCSATL